MIRASLYGRLGADPKALTTKNNKAMTRASLAVDCTSFNAESQETEWFAVVAFGRLAEAPARHQKGDMLAVSGALSRNRWTTKDGEERLTWQVVADDLHSSRTVRPTGGRRRQEAPQP